ncbi:MAG: hypothetical protein HY290_16365, partial [Planctomycetia bacterium]|nr:hypothetical protein [Planctomycetia bacterium]
MSDEEIKAFQAALPAEKRTLDDAQPFAKELVRQKKLTPYQATAIFQGKPRRLILGNVAFSLSTKIVFLLLALVGGASLWMAILADMGVSLLVTLN